MTGSTLALVDSSIITLVDRLATFTATGKLAELANPAARLTAAILSTEPETTSSLV